MKKRVLRFLCGVLAVMTVLPFASCAKVDTVTYRDGVYRNAKSKISYIRADAALCPVATGEQEATLKLDAESIPLYSVTGLSTEEWLAAEDGTLYAAEGAKIPTADEMELYEAQFCVESDTTLISRYLCEDVSLIRTAVAALSSETHIKKPDATSLVRYRVMCSSRTYPALYYTFDFISYKENIHTYVVLAGEEDRSGLPAGCEVVAEGEEPSGKLYAVVRYLEEDGIWEADINWGKSFVFDSVTRLLVPVFGLFNETLLLN